MKFPSRKSLVWTGLGAAFCLIIVACHKPATPLDWNMTTLVEAYKTAGHTNPKWDLPARRALTEFARVRAGLIDSNEEPGLIISNNCTDAVDAGCDDPMLRYLYVRNGMDRNISKLDLTSAFSQAAANLEHSTYPSIRKFYGWQRTIDQVRYAYGYGTNIPQEVLQYDIWGSAERDLLDALSDRTMPADEVYDACHEILNEYRGSKDRYATLYQNIMEKLSGSTKDSSGILLLKGEAYIEMAWHARGSGYANTVSNEAWEGYRKNLDLAENALTNAWRLNSNDARIPVKMMTVELGQGQGRERMELWFNRAMALNPNDYDACNSKLWYLEPKWYGSVDAMLSFGRECVQNPQWGGHVPLTLMDAHVAIQQEFTPASEKTNYWQRPAVWLDLKNAFERFFALNPEEISWYHNYAWFAYQAGQWDTLNEIIPKLGPVNYNYFGGEDEFNRMVALAKEHAKTKTNQ